MSGEVSLRKTFLVGACLASFALSSGARAETFDFTFSGPGVSGSIGLTYGTATDVRYSSALVVTAISGSISDFNAGIVNAPIGMPVSANFATPDSGNLLAPNSFSRFAVATGLPPETHGVLTYDNLFWPAGSLPTATDYTTHGGFLDIYGLLFDIGGGRAVNFWSNGDSGSGVDYGIAIATSAASLDYVTGGVSVPEPASLALLGVGVVALVAARRRAFVFG